MNEIGREERAWAVILRLVVICLIALGVNFMMSCEPEDSNCQYETRINSDGTGFYEVYVCDPNIQ
jgi:hypothetical protein